MTSGVVSVLATGDICERAVGGFSALPVPPVLPLGAASIAAVAAVAVVSVATSADAVVFAFSTVAEADAALSPVSFS
jgi:hypothetical protein